MSTDPVEQWANAVDALLAPPAHIYDAGCGTGRHAAALLARGHDVELADTSPDLLRVAARRCPGATTHLADIRRLPPDPRFDAVTCPGALDDLAGDERAAALRSLAGQLRSGGLLLLDVREACPQAEEAGLRRAGLTDVTVGASRSNRLLVTARKPGRLPTTPPLGTLTRVIGGLRRYGLAPALGGSGLLVALGLSERANDWDLTVDAPDEAVVAALAEVAPGYREATLRTGAFAGEPRYVVDGGDHDIDVLVNFTLRGPGGPERLPTRVTGRWRGIPLGDPAIEKWHRQSTSDTRPTR